MRHCEARYCERPVRGEAQFCGSHWALIPRDERERLGEAYGTAAWPDALTHAVRRLFFIESAREVRKRRRSWPVPTDCKERLRFPADPADYYGWAS